MASSLVFTWLLQPADMQLDWEAGRELIRSAEIKELADHCDNGYVDTLSDSSDEEIRDTLTGNLVLIETSLNADDAVEVPVINGTLWLAGGETWGDAPGALFEAIDNTPTNVLHAVGFQGSDGSSLLADN
jgi:hypothetical protein